MGLRETCTLHTAAHRDLEQEAFGHLLFPSTHGLVGAPCARLDRCCSVRCPCHVPCSCFLCCGEPLTPSLGLAWTLRESSVPIGSSAHKDAFPGAGLCAWLLGCAVCFRLPPCLSFSAPPQQDGPAACLPRQGFLGAPPFVPLFRVINPWSNSLCLAVIVVCVCIPRPMQGERSRAFWGRRLSPDSGLGLPCHRTPTPLQRPGPTALRPHDVHSGPGEVWWRLWLQRC